MALVDAFGDGTWLERAGRWYVHTDGAEGIAFWIARSPDADDRESAVPIMGDEVEDFVKAIKRITGDKS